MKSKNPSKQHVSRGAAGSGNRSGRRERAITLDFVQHRIEAFNREQGGGVIVPRTAMATPWYVMTRACPWPGSGPRSRRENTKCFTGALTPIVGGLWARWAAGRYCRSTRRSILSPAIQWNVSGREVSIANH